MQAVARVKALAVTVDQADEAKFRDLLLKCAATSMSSKLIHHQKPFFSKMVVDAVLTLDQDDLDESLIGIKKIPGGGMQDSLLINGVAFKKAFSYAGFEQQPKSFKNPKILCLNVELELKAERDNAEVRIEQVDVRSPPRCSSISSDRHLAGVPTYRRRRMANHLSEARKHCLDRRQSRPVAAPDR